MNIPTVAVVITTVNRSADMAALWAALGRQTQAPDEIIIIDESTDGLTCELARQWRQTPAGARLYYETATVRSVTRARNIGAARATSEFLMFLDDDAVPPDDYVARMAGTLHQLGDAYAGGCAAISIYADCRPCPPATDRFSRWFGLPHAADGRFQRHGMHTLPRDHTRCADTEFVSGGVNIYRRSVVAALRFDDRMSGYCNFDDADFSYRVSRRWKLFFAPDIRVYHKDVQDKKATRALRYYQSYMYSRNYLYHVHKNLPPTAGVWLGAGRVVLGKVLWALRRCLLTETRGFLAGAWDTLRRGPAPV